MFTRTTFGTVSRDEAGTTVAADGATLRDWARRGDCGWPCSQLARLEVIEVRFDTCGDLVDVAGTDEDLASDELNAWASETLTRAGYPSHPAIR